MWVPSLEWVFSPVVCHYGGQPGFYVQVTTTFCKSIPHVGIGQHMDNSQK